MKKYVIRMRNRMINKNVIVQASKFEVNSLTSRVIFKGKGGENVAIFSIFDIEYIKTSEEVD